MRLGTQHHCGPCDTVDGFRSVIGGLPGPGPGRLGIEIEHFLEYGQAGIGPPTR